MSHQRALPSADQILTVLRKVTSGSLYEALTCKRWKDGIDVVQPTFAAERLAEEFASLGAHSALQNGHQGWKLVPIDPTQEMVREAYQKQPDAINAGFAQAYRDMLAATPPRCAAGIGTDYQLMAEAVDHMKITPKQKEFVRAALRAAIEYAAMKRAGFSLARGAST